jgi:hypothetical protein
MTDTVRVKFLRGTALGNGSDAMPGEVVDLDRTLFAAFVQQGRVVEIAGNQQASVGVPAENAGGVPLAAPAKPVVAPRKGRSK